MFTSWKRNVWRGWLVPVCLAVYVCWAAGGAAAEVSNEAALTLLESHLPAKTPAERADCGQLAAAVRAAVHEQPLAAYTVVSMALSVPGKQAPRWAHRLPREFPCACVTKITQAALMASPAQASRILEAAVMLFPACAESLTAMLSQMETRYAAFAVANPNVTNGAASSDDPAMGMQDDGTGVGTGPGFPGAPGFAGGSSGGVILVALPPPVPLPVTLDTNG